MYEFELISSLWFSFGLYIQFLWSLMNVKQYIVLAFLRLSTQLNTDGVVCICR